MYLFVELIKVFATHRTASILLSVSNRHGLDHNLLFFLLFLLHLLLSGFVLNLIAFNPVIFLKVPLPTLSPLGVVLLPPLHPTINKLSFIGLHSLLSLPEVPVEVTSVLWHLLLAESHSAALALQIIRPV